MSGPGAVVAAPAPATTWMRGGDVAQAICSIEGCSTPATRRGWCRKHYARWLRLGDPIATKRLPAPERFWALVDKDGSVPDYAPHLGPCWLWTAYTDKLGYAMFSLSRDGHEWAVPSHRYAYELVVGPIPDGLDLDHLCRVPSCVNPSHLEPVTHRENMLRGFNASAINARKTHCVHGHPFSGDNLIVSTTGTRRCRTCHKAYYERLKSRTESRVVVPRKEETPKP